jgi:Reverse transcriptase (RNA-dependent DNA polymerase)
MIEPSVLGRMDLLDAVKRELSLRNRLLPRRWDYLALVGEHEAVEAALRPQLRRGPSGVAADVVLSDKEWRGVRPLHVMTLADRVLYRALVELIGQALPENLRHRQPIADFRQAPLDVPDVGYISKTDVTAYYEFVDHDRLTDELIAQTGEEPAVDVLTHLLGKVMKRRVGLPQVHTASDVLGDTYIDPVRRRMRRRGYATFTYSDDFRIASPTLGAARAAVEACAEEVRDLGLVLNDRKTYTYGRRKYRKSLTSFADAERRLFADGNSDAGDDSEDPFNLGFLDSDYGNADEPVAAPTLGAEPLDQGIDEDGALSRDVRTSGDLDERRVIAARRAWQLWLEEDESDETQAGQQASITQSLLGRALATLGTVGNEGPAEHLNDLLRYEPALAPQLTAYMTEYADSGRRARSQLRSALDDVVHADIFSPWQGMWLAQAAGAILRTPTLHPYEEWLNQSVAESRHDGLVATAAAALGRLGRGDADIVASAIDRVSPTWRRLVFWGLIGLDRQKAQDMANDKIDRLLLSVTAQ